MDYLFLLIGLVILLVGGELLVRGAVGISYRFKISPVIVGLTVVSFGTSAPELVISIQAAVMDKGDIAIGNVIGSNIANIALVLGITTLIFPLPSDRKSLRTDWPVLMGMTLLFFIFGYNLTLGRIEGSILLIILIAFTLYLLLNQRRINKKQKDSSSPEESEESNNVLRLIRNIAFLIAGCLGLMKGADWFVESAEQIALSFNISERVIGITLVAFGTSVPELATSCIAAFRKQAGISIGNLVGSNIFNIGSVLGITSIIKPIDISQTVLSYDFWWMLAVALILLPFILIGKKIGRIKGGILLIIYVVYVLSLLIQ